MRLRDRGCVMSMVFRKALPNHRNRIEEDESFVTVDANSNRILHFEKVGYETIHELPSVT